MISPSEADLNRLRGRLAELTRREITGLVVSDELGQITYIDAALARQLGWRPEELVGSPLTVLIPRRLRDAHHVGFSRFLVTKQPSLLDRALALVVCNRSGEELVAEHVITAMQTAKGWVFAAVIRVEPDHA